MLGLVGQVRVADGGENGVVSEDLLHLDQVDAGFDQVCGIGVTQAVWGDLFFRPQVSMAACSVLCTPPGSIDVVAAAAPFRPP